MSLTRRGRGDRARAALLRCEALAARLEAELLTVRSLLPRDSGNLAMLLGDQPYDLDLEISTTVEQCLYDLLPALREPLRQINRRVEQDPGSVRI